MNTLPNAATPVSILDNYVAVLKKYNDFNGRARRSEYWYFFLVNVIVTQGLNFINILIFNGSGLIGGLLMLLNLAILVPSVAVAIRRMHDVGKSGWYALIPLYNLILACTEGVKGINEYGDDPKQNA
ncbi:MULTISPECIES: DUF805 domain-containing protein [unclassified Spirosoma]|uniref:DUF805 domain-containing protein n=1 Tax=unclassified Spirosoma TaxID=2621999 RepID=UPI000A65B57C|nr:MULTISPECIES: DUF805 domain-containing protein [unclassified Spirosoma]MBN8826690.1 DUF805 domain-containing protein [Spirosoma sp.]